MGDNCVPQPNPLLNIEQRIGYSNSTGKSRVVAELHCIRQSIRARFYLFHVNRWFGRLAFAACRWCAPPRTVQVVGVGHRSSPKDVQAAPIASATRGLSTVFAACHRVMWRSCQRAVSVPGAVVSGSLKTDVGIVLPACQAGWTHASLVVTRSY